MNILTKTVLFWIVSCGIFLAIAGEHAGYALEANVDVTPSFRPGERLTYRLKWGKIPAGEAVLEVLPVNTIDGENVYHFSMTVKTNSYVDIFFKVRNQIEGFTDVTMSRSMLYKARQREGGFKRDVVVNFDWKNQQAQYSNAGKHKDPIPLRRGTFDPLSALYYTRSLPLRESATISSLVTDGKKIITGTVSVIKKQTVNVPAGQFKAFLVEPRTDGIGGVFQKSDNANIQLWLSADERKIPVKVRSKVAVGSFVGELVTIERLGMTTAYK